MKQDIEKEIRKYIQENAGTTENKVVDHITKKKMSSRMITLHVIGSLRQGEIIQDRQEGNSFHRLYVNDVSTFSKIEKELEKIERFIDYANIYFRKEANKNRANANTDIHDEFNQVIALKRF